MIAQELKMKRHAAFLLSLRDSLHEWLLLYKKELIHAQQPFKDPHGFAPCPKILISMAYYETPVGKIELAATKKDEERRMAEKELAEAHADAPTDEEALVADRDVLRFVNSLQLHKDLKDVEFGARCPAVSEACLW